MLIHPNFDPVVFSLGPLAVRWYGLMYLAGFAAGWWLGVHRIRAGEASGSSPLTRAQFDDLLFAAILGVILGGRLGYVLFYKPAYYFSHPLEVFAIWQGGMSFHGGFLGVLLAMVFFARRHRLRWLAVMDFVAPLVPLGIGALAQVWTASLAVGTARGAAVFPNRSEFDGHASAQTRRERARLQHRVCRLV